ncbi:hypothetical protein [Lentzea flaviverrucosa]|uniref:hypothetical protein n=1 Tax=Lentzea flaviverrucosa TaxID=200379 RepID=UPI000B7E1F8C|nr:hypothetical protein [Lentzea flaviverrucosa]
MITAAHQAVPEVQHHLGVLRAVRVLPVQVLDQRQRLPVDVERVLARLVERGRFRKVVVTYLRDLRNDHRRERPRSGANLGA